MAAYEYKDYSLEYPPGNRGYYGVGGGVSEVSARLFFWQAEQRSILPDIQEWLDDGWEAVTEIGPGAYTLRYYKSYRNYGVFGWIMIIAFIIGSAGVGLLFLPLFAHQFVEPTEFRVKMRKRINQ